MELGYGRNIAFSTGLEQEATLHARFPKLKVWVQERGGETLGVCLGAFRKRPGTLYIAGDLRILGESQEAWGAAYKQFKAARVVIHDIVNNERSDKDGVEMQRRAAAKMQYSKAMGGSRKEARVRGSKGGRTKGMIAAERRDALASEEVIERVIACPKLTWRERAYLLGISMGSLRRHYKRKQ